MKRYEAKRTLSDREIAAELHQVLDELPDIDIWILATCRELGDSEERNLRQRAQLLGIEAVALDAREEGVGPLQAACALFPDIVIAFCRDVTSFSEEILSARLLEIASHPGFQIQSSAVRERLQRASIGFHSIRRCAADWLKERLRSSQESMATFSQDIGLHDEGRAKPLQRVQITSDLWDWWHNGNCHEWRCSVLGEEGVGKTWATMSWLLTLAQNPSSPIILPLTSSQMPHTNDFGEIVPKVMSKRFGRTEIFWERRIVRWGHGHLGYPPILLLFDGLNEKPKVPWRLLLEQASADAYRNKIAILTTCRPSYWKKIFFSGTCKLIQTEGYDNCELEQTLRVAGRHLSEVPQVLRPLIRRPRYCDLVLQHFDRMAEDPTVERLLYEDYRNRLTKKATFPLTPEDFREILASLAQKYTDGVENFKQYEVEQYLSGTSEASAALQEIIDGGLLVETGLPSQPLRVDKRRLIHGLGMLLSDHLREGCEKTVAEHLESIGAWLEPGPEMEIKSPIVGAAIFFATIEPLYPSTARRALLEYWLCRRNVPDDEEEILTAYFPECPEDLLAVADSFWGEKVDNQVAQERLTWAILSRRDHPRVKPALINATKRWMSYVNIGGYPSNKDIHGDRREKAITAMQERLGREVLVGENIHLGSWTFSVIDDDRKFFISRLAIKAICAGDRLPFVEAFVIWALSRAIMGDHYETDKAAWTLRLTNEPLWDVLKNDLETMAQSEFDLYRRAADILLWCMGRRDCFNLRNRLLNDLHPKPDWLLEHEEDPCKGIFAIDRGRYQECLSREDIPINSILWKLNKYLPEPDLQAPPSFVSRMGEECYRLPLNGFRRHWMGKTAEEAEIDRFIDVAARFTPTHVGNILRSIVRDIPNRSDEAQLSLISYLPKISILLGAEELQVVQEALFKIRSSILEFQSEQSKLAESDGTIAILYHLSAEDSVSEILNRPPEAFDDCDFLIFFQKISPSTGYDLANKILCDSDTRFFLRLLWILSMVSPDVLSKEHESRLLEFLSGEDTDLRFGAMRYAYNSGNQSLMKRVIQEKTAFTSNNSLKINSYGAAILLKISGELSFDTIVERLSLPDIIRAVKIRGCVPHELDFIASVINYMILSKPIGSNSTNGKLVLAVVERDKHAFGGSIRIDQDVLLVICEKFPSIIKSWVDVIFNKSESYLHIFSGFYHSLCEALLKKDSSDGIRLWQKIKSIRGTSLTTSWVDWLSLMAFSALPQNAGHIVCDELLSTAISDLELYRIVLSAREYDKQKWISDQAEALLKSPHLWQRGKGLMLIAFSDNDSIKFSEAIAEADVDGSWLENAASSMKDIYDRNNWGKYWYNKFLTVEDEDDAFCAWHLFLKCIDSRCFHWMKKYKKELCLPETKAEKRTKFCHINESRLKYAIEEKEKEYKERFITIKMSSFDRDWIKPYQNF